MAGQQRGIITTWKDEKGFGFITPERGDEDVFFHITDVAGRGVRPAERTVVYYTLTYDEKRRPRAVHVHLQHESLAPVAVALTVSCAFFLLLGGAMVRGLLPSWIGLAYIILSGITYLMYGDDKLRAGKGLRRTEEYTLHMLELWGGWPGALVAQWYFRHKNRKRSYQLTFWMMVGLNICLLAVGSVVYVALAAQ